jgi:hypothetical protein
MARRQDLHARLSVPSSRRFSTHELARAWLATLAATLLAQARAEDSSPAVDLELVLAVDVSSSMTKDELRVQRGGYVSALRDPQVVSAILSGARGRIAIAYFEWASPEHQRLLMPWTVVDGPASIEAFAAGLEAQPIAPAGEPRSPMDWPAGELRFPAASPSPRDCSRATPFEASVRSSMFLATAPTIAARPFRRRARRWWREAQR